MVKIENDLTLQSRPAIIVAGPRTGGTFLTHCLDAHPQMHWDRGEPFHPQRRYKRLGLSEEAIAGLLFETPGYQVSGFRALYGELLPETWDAVAGYEPRVIHLIRRNVLRQAVSVLINQMVRKCQIPFHPLHTFGDVEPVSVRIDPDVLLTVCTNIASDVCRWSEFLWTTGLPVLGLTYREIIGGRQIEATYLAPNAMRTICRFLDVEWQSARRLWCNLKRINRAPLSEIIINWDKVRDAISASEFHDCLRDEANAP